MPRSCSSLPRSALGALIVAVLASFASGQTLLPTSSESLDGEVRDLAAPADATASPDAGRVWIAQGRVRAAIRVSDRSRRIGEDRTYTSSPGHKDIVRAVAVDDDAKYVYTLTDRALYRESFGAPYSQAQPGDQRVFIVPSGQKPIDVEVVTGGWLVLVTESHLYTIQSNPGGVIARGVTETVFPLTTNGADPALDALGGFTLLRATVSIDQRGHYLAFCRMGVARYGLSPRISMVDPYPQALLVADLGDVASGFTQPTFDADPSPARSYVYWDPYSAAPAYGASSDDRAAHCLYDVDAHVVSGETHVWCACGRSKQLHELRVQFGTSHAVTDLGALTVDPGQDLFLCRRDPTSDTRLLVYSAKRLVSVDTATSSVLPSQQVEPFVLGGLGEPAFVAIRERNGSITPTLWTGGASTVDNVLKVFNVGGAQPKTYEHLGGLWRSDGAVALDATNVYTPTWGGVAHYELQGGRWVQRDCRATSEPDFPGQVYATEQIALATLAPAKHSILIAANTATAHGLIEMALDQDASLTSPRFFTSRFATQALNWDPTTQSLWSNDVAFLDYDGRLFALLDLANDTLGGAALLAYRWRPVEQDWSLASWCSVPTPGPGAGLTATITLADGANGRRFAFVGHDSGVFTVDLTDLALPTPSMHVASTLWCPLGGTRHRFAWGVAVTGDHAIVCFNNRELAPVGPTGALAPVQPTIEVFGWNPGDGSIHATADRVYRPTDPSDPLYVPNYYRVFRSRFLADAGSHVNGRAFLSGQGYVHGLRYDRFSPSDPLRLESYWKSDYSNAIQDSRIYDFGAGPRLLVSKDSEAFAWVVP